MTDRSHRSRITTMGSAAGTLHQAVCRVQGCGWKSTPCMTRDGAREWAGLHRMRTWSQPSAYENPHTGTDK